MECEKCQRWVHCKCYGYKDSEDSRISNFHFCYKCLYEDDPTALEESLAMVKRRKILNFILEKDEIKQDESFNSQIAQELVIPKKEVKEFLESLQKDKVLFHRPYFHEGVWKVTQSSRKLQSLNNRYFDPLANMATPTRRPGSVSSVGSEILSSHSVGQYSDTDYSDNELPKFTRMYSEEDKNYQAPKSEM